MCKKISILFIVLSLTACSSTYNAELKVPLNEVIINNSNNELLHINELKRVGLYSKDTSIE